MMLFLLPTLLLILYRPQHTVNQIVSGRGWLSRLTTESIKGVFIIIVFLRHVHPYITRVDSGALSSLADKPYFFFDNIMSQLLVVMFLLYSGYFVMSNILAKGSSYVDAIPSKRIFTVLVNFDIAVVLFLILDWIYSVNYTPYEIAMSFVGWKSVGNSNWYIFVILLCYFLTWISFSIFKNPLKSANMLTLLIIIYMAAAHYLKESLWYDTVLAFPAGVYICYYKDRVLSIIKGKEFLWFVAGFALSVLMYKIPVFRYGFFANIRAMALIACVIGFTLWRPWGNPILAWFGKNLFPIYIYQRIPMIILSHIDAGGFMVSHPYLFVICSFLFTLPFVWFYDKTKITFNRPWKITAALRGKEK